MARSDSEISRREVKVGFDMVERAYLWGAFAVATAFGLYNTHQMVKSTLPSELIIGFVLMGGAMAWAAAMGSSAVRTKRFVASFGFGLGMMMGPVLYIPIRMLYEMGPFLIEVFSRAW